MKKILVKILFFSLFLGLFSFSGANTYTLNKCKGGPEETRINKLFDKIDKKIENKSYAYRKAVYYKIVDIAQKYINRLTSANYKNKKFLGILYSIQCKAKARLDFMADNNTGDLFYEIEDSLNQKTYYNKDGSYYENDYILLKDFGIKFKVPEKLKELNFSYEILSDSDEAGTFAYVSFKVGKKNNGTEFLRILQAPISEYEKTMNCNSITQMCGAKETYIGKNSQYFYFYAGPQDWDENGPNSYEVGIIADSNNTELLEKFIKNIKVVGD